MWDDMHNGSAEIPDYHISLKNVDVMGRTTSQRGEVEKKEMCQSPKESEEIFQYWSAKLPHKGSD